MVLHARISLAKSATEHREHGTIINRRIWRGACGEFKSSYPHQRKRNRICGFFFVYMGNWFLEASITIASLINIFGKQNAIV
jgi:hypothetical protein